MDYLRSFAISAAGMSVERARVEVASLNLANANTIVHGGQGYQPLRALVLPATHGAYSARFGELMGADASPQVRIEPTARAPRQVLEPGHPMADAAGFVSYPGVDTTTEMVSLMTALRAYEANVVAMNAARTVAVKALEIGA